MELAAWAAFAGVVLLVMGSSPALVARLPLSTSMLYLVIGVAASPLLLGWTVLSPVAHAEWLEPIAEVVILLSLFTAGLKMSLGLGNGRWLLPVRLASASMLVTVALIALCGVIWLDLPLGAAILLCGSQWLAIDLAWGVVGGLAIGALLGTLTGCLVLYLRSNHGEAVGLDSSTSTACSPCVGYLRSPPVATTPGSRRRFRTTPRKMRACWD